MSQTSLILSLTVPLNGTECVDAYRVTATIINKWTLLHEIKVTNQTQTNYVLEFPFDMFDDVSVTNITAVAITNGTEGSIALIHVMDNANLMCELIQNIKIAAQ